MDDFSEPSVTAAIELNLVEMVELRSLWTHAEVHNDPKMVWCMTDIPFPLFNPVLRANLSPERVTPAIQSVIDRSKTRKVPIIWGTGPSTRPGDLGEKLVANGFISAGEMPGMAVNLKEIKAQSRTPEDFTIKRVATDAEIRTCCQIAFALTGGMPAPVVDAYADMYTSMGVGTDSAAIHYYLGLLAGKPVATAMLVLGAGVAGLYNIATIPEAQRKGIGSAMTLAPLLDARELGYQAGILQSSEMGYNVYSHLGFREYFKIGIYMWSEA